MDITKETIERIGEMAVEAEGARVVDLTNGATILLNSKTDADYIHLTPPTKDSFGIPLTNPVAIKRTVTIQTVDSLVEYVTRFKEPGATLFADIARDRIVAILDYHETPNAPDLAQHIAVLQLTQSEEWKIWQAAHEKLKPQLEFARFIEENGPDIFAPDPADILECTRDLQAVRKVNFTKAVRTNTDAERFEYSEDNDIKSRGDVEVPTKFMLKLPVYFDSRSVELRANLRWNLAGDQLVLGIALSRAEYVRQALFKEIVGDIAQRASVPAIYGNATSSVSL